MGRHSSGGGRTPPPAPEPDAPHPYAPRSAEDTGVWDHRTYRVVDVGLPTGTQPRAFPLADPPAPARGGPPEASGRRGAPSRVGSGEPRYGATRADLVEPSRFRTPDPEPTRRRAPEAEPSRRRTPEAEPSRRRAPEPEPSRFGDPESSRRRAPDPEPSRFRAPDPEPVRRRAPEPEAARLRAPEPSRFRELESSRYGAEPEPPRYESPRYGATRADLVEPVRVREKQREEPRYGATRFELAGESVGSAALAPVPETAPDPDEVTDTGARRARSRIKLAEPEDDEHEDEPSLLLQWGIFVAQTLTGAIGGLGVWLGFYRLWSVWPFYAAPAVGVAAILMLVLARHLRHRHGHDLDLMTSIVTVGIATVLTVLPAAFTLQHLAQ